MARPRFFTHFAGSAGNDDTYNANGAHAAKTDYYIKPPAGEKWEVARLIGTIYDTKGLEPEKYTAGGALAAGIQLVVSRNGTEEVLTAEPITQLHHWAHYCHDVTLQSWTNTTNEAVTFRWTFTKAGAPIVLTSNDKLIVRCLAGCNCSALLEHHFVFQGVSLAYVD